MNTQEEIKSIKENIQKETDRLAKLEAQLKQPESLEDIYNRKTMFFLSWRGRICADGSVLRQDGYASRERAEKELLRIRLTQIADHLNGGLFEPEKGEKGYYLVLERNSNTVAVGDNTFDSYGKINFKTEKLAELAKTYFTSEELIKMLK